MRLAIFGGTFDPPHLMHKKIVDYISSLGYDKVVVVVSGTPYYKSSISSFYDRYNMASIAFKDVDVSDVDKGGSGVAFEYVNNLVEIYHPSSIDFFIGSDQYLNLDKWKNIDELKKYINFIHITRDYCELGIDLDLDKTSSTDIRKTKNYDDVDIEVKNYIIENDLYKEL